MKRKTKRKLKYKNIFLLIFAIINIAFIVFLSLSNIIPTIYFIPLVIIITLLYLSIFILIKKKKKLGYFLSIILIIIYIFVTYYLGITLNFFSSINKIHYNETNYLVIVLNSSEYNTTKDLKNKTIGYINNDEDNIEKAIEKLDKKVKINKKDYSTYPTLFDSLDNKTIESILVEESYYNIKKEEEEENNYKIIDTIKIRKITNKSLTKEVDITKKPFTIYISGIDTYGSIETVSRSDVNILVTVNPSTKQILLVSIPRDSYVQLSGKTGYKDKLTHAGIYGISTSLKTIEDFLNIDINYYIKVNFSTLEKLIDSLGGVTVYSEYSFVSYIDNYKFYKGFNNMNGKEALAFARERKSLPNGDIDRGKNQEAVIEAIIRASTSKEMIYKYSSVLNALNGSFQTNLTDKDITSFIKKELTNPGGWTITSKNITGTGQMNYTYSYSAQKLYVMIPDEDSINEVKKAIDEVINGKTLESSYTEPTNPKNPQKILPEVNETKQEDKPSTKDNDIKKSDVTDNNTKKEENKTDDKSDITIDEDKSSNKDNTKEDTSNNEKEGQTDKTKENDNQEDNISDNESNEN